MVRRKLAAFDGRNLPGWLYRIACRTASDRRRRAWLLRLVLRAPDHPELDDIDEQTPAVLLERREARRLVTRVMDRLRAPHRRALALFEIEGYSVAEIAALEGIPSGTVKTRLVHARRRFREQLATIDPEFDEP